MHTRRPANAPPLLATLATLALMTLAGCGEPPPACSTDADCAALDDGDPCTGAVRCFAATGTCEAGPPVSCDPSADTLCSANRCDPKTGACAPSPRNSGAPCEDGDPCTLGDACAAGACKAGPATGCSCTKDADCADDGDLCNGTPRCVAGSCETRPGSAVVCDASSDTICSERRCDPKTGACAAVARNNGAACEDGDPCTATGKCGAGSCEPGDATCPCESDADCPDGDDKCAGSRYCDKAAAPYVCRVNVASVVSCPSKATAPCQAFACDPKDGQCKTLPLLDGSGCDDGEPCTASETCKGGVCQGGADVCVCKSDADCEGQEDADLCNGTLYCDIAAAKCKVNPATVVSCPKVDAGPCTANVCNPSTGTCALTPVKPGTPCDDGEPCTKGEICVAGTCGKGTNTCACKSDKDCLGKDDGNVCNGVPYCNQQIGACETNPATQVQCPSADDSACSKSACVPLTGACTPTAVEATFELPHAGGGVRYEVRPAGAALGNPPACDDGDPCTAGEICAKGQCQGGTFTCACTSDADCAGKDDGDLCNGVAFCNKAVDPPACQPNPKTVVSCKSVDDSACVKNLCQPKTGKCAMTPLSDGAACDDGNPCTKNDFCSAAKCNGGVVVCACQTHADCLAKDDGDLCNGVPYCDKSDPAKPVCKPNPASVVLCDKSKDSACAKAACNPASGTCGLVAVNEGKPCEDNSVCTTKTTCEGGSCEGATQACDDGNACTFDTCDPSKGCQHLKANCDDGNDCTADVCDAKTGACAFVTSGAQGAACNADGNGCTIGDACDQGVCKAGPKVPCALPTKACEQALCVSKSATSFQCVVAAVPEGGACDDGDKCTVGDSCKAGQCVPGSGSLLKSVVIDEKDVGDHAPSAVGAVPTGDGGLRIVLQRRNKVGSENGWATVGLSAAGSFSTPTDITMTNYKPRTLVASGSSAPGTLWLAGDAGNIAGDRQLAVARVDTASGKVLIAAHMGVTTAKESATCAVVRPQGPVVGGWRSAGKDAHALVMQVTSGGQALWTWTDGKPGDTAVARALLARDDGTLLVAGDRGPTGKAGAEAPWVARLSTTGKALWLSAPAQATGQLVRALAPLGAGAALLTQGTATAKGVPTWLRTVGSGGALGEAAAWTGSGQLRGARQHGPGRLLLWGAIDALSGTAAPWLAEIDGHGLVQWQRTLPYPSPKASVAQVTSAPGGGLLVTGRAVGKQGLVARLDAWGHSSCGESGVCLTKAVSECDDNEPCTADGCGAKGCVHSALDGATCGDGESCAGEGVCAGGSCKLPPQGRLWVSAVTVPNALKIDDLAADAKGATLFGRSKNAWLAHHVDPRGKVVASHAWVNNGLPGLPIGGVRKADGSVWIVGVGTGANNGGAYLVHLDAKGKKIQDMHMAFIHAFFRFDLHGPNYVGFDKEGRLLIFGAHPQKFSVNAYRYQIDMATPYNSKPLIQMTNLQNTSGFQLVEGGAAETVDGGHLFVAGSTAKTIKIDDKTYVGGVLNVIRYTPKGAVAWHSAVQDKHKGPELVVRAVTELADGSVVWAGAEIDKGAFSPVLGRLSAKGVPLAYRHVPGHVGHLPEHITPAPGGGLQIAGFGPTDDGKGGLWSARLSIDGQVLSEQTIGGGALPSVGRLPHNTVAPLPGGGLVQAGSGAVGGQVVVVLARRDAWGHASCAAAGACAEKTAQDCSDSDACTADLCSAKAGCAATKLSCDDGNPCTTDTCTSAKGCVHAVAKDGSVCGTDQICASGVCTAKKTP